MIRKLISVICLFVMVRNSYAQIPVERLDSLMQVAFHRGIFNGNVLIARNGQIIYQRSMGYADGSKTQKLTADHKFDIGSISKEFNGVSIILLKEQSKLKLDDPISKYLTGLPDWATKVQLKHLINYTSGLPNFTAQSDETDAQLLDSLQHLKALKFEPGSAYIYAHANVYLQKRIIEQVSGLEYADFVRQFIFRPCGMRNSIMDADLSSSDVAKAFDNDFKPTTYIQLTTGYPRLTVADLYRFNTQLESFKIISEASFKELSLNFPGGESSLGTTVFSDSQLTWHRHQGSNSNYEALLYSDQKRGLAVILMTNNQQMKVDGIKNALISALEGQPFTIPKRSFYLEIRDKVLDNADHGLAYYRELKVKHQDIYDFSFETGDLISTGKYLLRRNKFDGAIKVFQTAVALPTKPADIAYGYELIGEAYLKEGDKANARINYQQAVDTDPNNKNAKAMLSALN